MVSDPRERPWRGRELRKNGEALGLDGDDLGDAGHLLLEQTLDPLFQGHWRYGTALASPIELHDGRPVAHARKLDVPPVHLDGGPDQLEGLFDLVFHRDRLAHGSNSSASARSIPVPCWRIRLVHVGNVDVPKIVEDQCETDEGEDEQEAVTAGIAHQLVRDLGGLG
jgi:hypothetical protein